MELWNFLAKPTEFGGVGVQKKADRKLVETYRKLINFDKFLFFNH